MVLYKLVDWGPESLKFCGQSGTSTQGSFPVTDSTKNRKNGKKRTSQMNPCAKEFCPRRRAAVAAAEYIRCLAHMEADEHWTLLTEH